MKFVKVSSARKARLVIKNTRRMPGGCGTGYGTLGYPGPGAVTPTEVGGGFSVTVSRAPEPVVPAWLGTWAHGEPGFEVHATPAACTAVTGDDTTQVGLGLWGATPVGGAADEYLRPVPAGPVCLSVWQFDQGYNFALAPATVMVTGTGARVTARTVDLAARATARPTVVRFD